MRHLAHRIALNEVTEKGHFEDQPDNHVEFFYRAMGKSLILEGEQKLRDHRGRNFTHPVIAQRGVDPVIEVEDCAQCECNVAEPPDCLCTAETGADVSPAARRC